MAARAGYAGMQAALELMASGHYVANAVRCAGTDMWS